LPRETGRPRGDWRRSRRLARFLGQPFPGHGTGPGHRRGHRDPSPQPPGSRGARALPPHHARRRELRRRGRRPAREIAGRAGRDGHGRPRFLPHEGARLRGAGGLPRPRFAGLLHRCHRRQHEGTLRRASREAGVGVGPSGGGRRRVRGRASGVRAGAAVVAVQRERPDTQHHALAGRLAAPEGTARLKTSVLANLAGNGVVAAINILVVPLYLHVLGIESWGLVGFFMTLQTALSLLDLGLSPAASRSLARGTADTGGRAGPRDLVKTLELVYAGVALLIVAGVALAAPALAGRWLHVERLSAETVRDALRLMGAVIAVQWPTSLYRGGLQGLDRQVSLNAILAGTSLVRAIATLAVLWTVSATILAFFACQLAVAALQTVLLRAALWRSLPAAGRPSRVRLQTLAGIRRFAGGMTAVAAVTLILTQVDKLVVSKLLPLGEVGCYTLASMIARALALVSGAMFNALFPEYSRSVAAGGAGLAALYHRGCQLTSVLVLPVASVIVLFPRETVLVWTGAPLTAGRTALAASLLVGGSALNGLMNPPYALQLAHGWTTLVFRSNVV